MALYLAIDLGTTGCRSILFDEKLTQLRDSYREYGLITPRENWVEQDQSLVDTDAGDRKGSASGCRQNECGRNFHKLPGYYTGAG